MAQLFDTQPDDNEPLEYTHFDCWFSEDGGALDAFYDAELEDIAPIADDILKHWAERLGVRCSHGDLIDTYPCQGNLTLQTETYGLYPTIGIEGVLDLAVLQILMAGYDVYRGGDFIEIYKGNSNE